MMLADPGRMHAQLVGIDRLVEDVGDEDVGRARVVLVMIVAEREIAEIHGAALSSLPMFLHQRRGARNGDA